MSIRRKRRRAPERRIPRASKRTSIAIWMIIAIILLVLAIGIARTFR